MSWKNPALLLLDDYAGQVSEMTAICQYLHHYFVVDKEDVAELLEKIAIEEMEHLEDLGHTLANWGIDPRFFDSSFRYWNGSYVDYQYDVCDILRSDIRGEILAIQQYYQHMQAIPDQHIRNLLDSIINDELIHIQQLTEKLAKYCPVYRSAWLNNEIEDLAIDSIYKDKLQLMLKQIK